ncbi:MAG: hypothetical protein M1118_04480 [Chloroflexi bacterium]|nr:hypothetical protein [Chloroflexota bacterium]
MLAASLLTALVAGTAGCGRVSAPPANLPVYVPHVPPTPPSSAGSAAVTRQRAAPAISPVSAPPAEAGSIAHDNRFAVDMDALPAGSTAHALQVLHVQWFAGSATGVLDHSPDQIQSLPTDPAQVAVLARRYPGRVWSFGQEPNGITASSPESQPAAYAARLHAVATALHAADPTARLLGPDVLDWSAGCTGCGGMTTGQAWTEAMRKAYLAAYGQEVPFDIWSIHTYPLDWQHLPTVNYQEMEQQLIGLRHWLDSIPNLRDKPIWDTELGVHWGYTAYQFATVDGKSTLLPAGQLRTDLVENYLRQFLAWLVINGPRYDIARWFVFAAYNPDVPGDHAGAISLLDGPGPDVRLTSFGRIFLAAQQ